MPGGPPDAKVRFWRVPKSAKITCFRISTFLQKRTGTVVKLHFSAQGAPRNAPGRKKSDCQKNVAVARETKNTHFSDDVFRTFLCIETTNLKIIENSVLDPSGSEKNVPTQNALAPTREHENEGPRGVRRPQKTSKNRSKKQAPKKQKHTILLQF